MECTKYFNYEFESSTAKTPEFKAFSRAFKKDIMKQIHPMILADYSVGHFYISGFIYDVGKYVYFSIADVRDTNLWHNNILIRTATGIKDYTGGRNHFTSLEQFGENVSKLMKERI